MFPVKDLPPPYYNFEKNPLAAEVIENIFWRLHAYQDVFSFGITSKAFHGVYASKYIWNPLLKKLFPNSVEQNHSNSEGIELFQKFKILENNIKKGIKISETLAFNFEGENGICQIHGNRLFHLGGHEDDPIEVFDLSTQTPLTKLENGENYICCLHVNGDYLYSGGSYARETPEGYVSSCMLSIWNLNTLEQLGTLTTDYMGGFNSLFVREKELFAAVDDKVVIFDLTNDPIEKRVLEFPREITSLRVYENTLILQMNSNILNYHLDTLTLLSECRCCNPFLSFEIYDQSLIILASNQFQVYKIGEDNKRTFTTNLLLSGNLFQIVDGRFYIKDGDNIHILDFNG